MPAELRRRHRVLDVAGWFAVIGILALVGAMWGPDELSALLGVIVPVTAAAASLHALARPALLRWANPSQDLELPAATQALLDGTVVRCLGVATGTVSEGGAESDDLRLRVGSRVLLAPVVADLDPRRLAALALTARTADRGVTTPTVLWAGVAVLAGVDGWWTGATVAGLLAVGFVGIGAWHAWRSRWPGEAVLERTGMDAVLFSHLLLGWTTAARSAREDPEHAEYVWKLWFTTARDPAERADGLTADNVDAELARLPRWEG
ncbi:hypothetical protein [Egicoccus sp. AB-alg2]|uniref:hypothetical protein n=1 Tax=Egicoccus sp. AB-alg2 TaxID=3242693 RepID=UPI00359E2B9A